MSIDPRLGYPIGASAGLLVIAQLVAFALRREDSTLDLARRIRSWWVMVLICALALFSSPVVVLVLLALVSFVALKEYFSVVPTRMADRTVLLVAYLAIPTQWWWIGTGKYGLFIIWVPVYLFVLVPSIMVLRGSTAGFLHALGTLYWGLMLCVFTIGHAAYLVTLPEGALLLLTLLLLTQGNDVAQYVCGHAFGRRRIAPQVSPNKTVEGFAGGFVSTVALAGLVGPLLTPLSLPMALAAGALLAISGFLGDLTVSAVKRDLGIKDTGTLIPGHGGLLDRVDSLVFAAPLFFHFVRYFYF